MEDDDVFGRMLADAAGALGLDPPAAQDARAVKRAYAAQLKLHRPDQDPEGFRRIRDAYELLTSIRRTPTPMVDGPSAVAADPAPVAATEPVALVATEAPVDDALAQAIARLTTVCAESKDEAAQVGAAWQVWRLARQDQPERGLTALGAAFANQPHLLGQALGDDGLALAFERGRGDLGAAVLQYWTQHDLQRLSTFAKWLAVHMGKGNHQFALLGLRLAEVLSLRDPAVADGLLNRLFLDLPPQMRGATLAIEQRVALGRELTGLPSLSRRFMWEVIDRDPSTPVPMVPANVLKELEALPAAHPARAVLREVMPDLKLGFNWAGTAQMPIRTRADSYHQARDVDSSSTWRMPFGIAFVLFILVSAAVRNMSTPTVSMPRLEYNPPPLPTGLRHDAPSPFPNPPSPFPATNPIPTRDQQGLSHLTPQQRETLRRILEKNPQNLSPSQQERLRRLLNDPAPELPPRITPSTPPSEPKPER